MDSISSPDSFVECADLPLDSLTEAPQLSQNADNALPPSTVSSFFSQLSIPIYEITSLEKKMTAFVIPNAIQITTRQAKYTFASFLSRDTTFDVIYNIWRLARPEDGSVMSSGRGSIDNVSSTTPAQNGTAGAVTPAPAAGGAAAATPAATTKKVTQCTCGKEGKHYTETAMDVVVPGTPEKIHALIFSSAFIKDFMVTNQKLMGESSFRGFAVLSLTAPADIQMSDWAPVTPGSHLLTRNFSYIKPLNGALGPKSTKCELKDEMVYADFNNYASTVTTTRTPDVPSGGVFSVKTRTCITWASAISSRIVVTTQVEWTGRSFIKGTSRSTLPLYILVLGWVDALNVMLSVDACAAFASSTRFICTSYNLRFDYECL